MFFRKRKKIELYEQSLNEMFEKVLILKNKVMKLEDVLANIKTLLKDHYVYRIQEFYEMENSQYIVIIYRQSTDFKVFKVVTYQIDCAKPITVCKADIEFHTSSFYSLPYCELVNLDTMYERRRGHASRCSSNIEIFSLENGINKIMGMLYFNTDIGIDNLINFYHFNGYSTDLQKMKFEKNL